MHKYHHELRFKVSHFIYDTNARQSCNTIGNDT